jgi:hypothetical protein
MSNENLLLFFTKDASNQPGQYISITAVNRQEDNNVLPPSALDELAQQALHSLRISALPR